MRVTFRVDSSIEIGTGHVMRCLTLADALTSRGASCSFVCRLHTGNITQHILNRGYIVHALAGINTASLADNSATAQHSSWLGVRWEQDALETIDILNREHTDWLIIDHYGIDIAWENTVKDHCVKVMCIDDLGDRSHNCDFLLDQSVGATKSKYQSLVRPETTLFLGPYYALLRSEFAALRHLSLKRRSCIDCKTILVSMGGVDRNNYTTAIIKTFLRDLDLSKFEIRVVLGQSNPWVDYILTEYANLHSNIQLYTSTTRMAELMASSDIFVGAGGTTVLEQCCMGLPSIIIPIAQNQIEIANELKSADLSFVVKNVDELSNLIVKNLNYLSNTERLLKISHNSSSITDGLGSDRIVTHLYSDTANRKSYGTNKY